MLFCLLFLLLMLSLYHYYFYLTSVKRHVNDKTNLKIQSLRLGLFI